MGHGLPADRRGWPPAAGQPVSAHRGAAGGPPGAQRVLDPWAGRRAARDRSDRLPAHRPERPAPGRGGHLLGEAGVNVRLWGTRGSLAAPGPDTVRYGGNTACVQVSGKDGSVLVLDGGTGIRRVGPLL